MFKILIVIQVQMINIIKENKENITSLRVLEILSGYELISAFPNLYLAVKYLCTLPASSASAERSFSMVILFILTNININMG